MSQEEELMRLLGMNIGDDLTEMQGLIESLKASGQLSSVDSAHILLQLLQIESKTVTAEKRALMNMSLTVGRPC